MNFGLPDRNSLVERLAEVLKETIEQKDYEPIEKEEDILLKIFRITNRLRAASEEGAQNFSALVRDRLYDELIIMPNSMPREAMLWLECLYQTADICGTYVTFNWTMSLRST